MALVIAIAISGIKTATGAERGIGTSTEMAEATSATSEAETETEIVEILETPGSLGIGIPEEVGIIEISGRKTTAALVLGTDVALNECFAFRDIAKTEKPLQMSYFYHQVEIKL